ncbi:hypothetical protein GEMRC1_010841 [Eukaryota sp. GEM-RC1]
MLFNIHRTTPPPPVALPKKKTAAPSSSASSNRAAILTAEKLIANAAEKYEIEGFHKDTFAPMWSAIKRTTLQEVEASSLSSSLANSLDDLSVDLLAPSFFGDPSPPDNFHIFILPKVLSLIRLISPSALSSQEDLWDFLLATTRAQNASEARSLISSLNMKGTNTEALNSYLEQLRSVVSRTINYVSLDRPKIIVESFLKGLKPSSLRNSLFDEHRLSAFNSLDILISRTLYLHQNSVLSESETPISSRLHRDSSRSSFPPRSNYRNSNPSGHSSNFPSKKPFISSDAKNSLFCNFCKKTGHTIEFCRDPECKRSSVNKPAHNPSSNSPSRPSTSSTNPRNPKATFDNSRRITRSYSSKTN